MNPACPFCGKVMGKDAKKSETSYSCECGFKFWTDPMYSRKMKSGSRLGTDLDDYLRSMK